MSFFNSNLIFFSQFLYYSQYITFLQLARNKGFGQIVVELDSKVIVNFMKEDSGVNIDSSTLLRECKCLAMTWGSIRFSHIYREGNKYANFLANLGQQGTWGVTILDESSDGIKGLLRDDASGALMRRIR